MIEDIADKRFTVVIADSHEIVREGITSKITEMCDVDVVGQAENGYEALKVCRNANPDILIMDLSLVRPSGLDTFKKIRHTMPEVKILIISSEAISAQAFSTLSNGAVGYMPKQAKSSHFVAAINAIVLGYSCFPADYISDFSELRNKIKRSGNIYGLSAREIEVLIACCDGAKSSEVAELLSISVRTVETHRNAIYRKTDCRDLSELAKIANEL